MEILDEIVFYTLEKSIKTYRQFAQKRITEAGFEITIDQWLILKTIQENPDCSQNQIAEKVFKDFASVTRIIELLVKKDFLSRNFHANDRRRFELTITETGQKILDDVFPIVSENRQHALRGFSSEAIERLEKYLKEITSNCNQ